MYRVFRVTSCMAVVLVLCAGLWLAGCSDNTGTGNQPPLPEPGRTPAQLTSTEQSIVDNTNEFAFAVFRRVCEETPVDSNVFISPLSISYALSLAASGADGATQDSMLHALSLGEFTMTDVNENYRTLAEILTNADSDVTMRIANSVWADHRAQLHPEYVSDAQTYYDARVESMDFDQPSTLDTINQWVRDQTNNRIEKILDPPIGDLIAVLLNAIYFNAPWRVPFDTARHAGAAVPSAGRFVQAMGDDVTERRRRSQRLDPGTPGHSFLW